MELKKGYKQTEIGIIPKDWDVKSIKEIAQITTGAKDTQNKIDDGKYPFYVRSQTIERINSYSFDGEAVLTSGDGVGVGKIFHYINGKFDFHQRVYNIHSFNDYSGKLFYYYFSNHFFDRVMQMTAKSSVDSVRREMIAEMKIPIPPTLYEQKSIAKVLTDTDQLIQNLKTLISKKKAIKQGAMQEFFNDEKSLLGYDSEWNMYSLKDLCSYINDGTHHTPKYVDKGIPFYSVESLSKNFKNVKYISEQEHLKLISRCKPEQGDILLTRIGTLGITKLIDWEVNASIYVSLALLKVKKDKIDSEYLYSYTKSDRFIQDIIKRSLTNATPQKINMGEIGEVPIYFPSNIEEQKTIAQILTDMDSEIEALEIQLQKTQNLKQGMMQELLTGKIRLVNSKSQSIKKEIPAKTQSKSETIPIAAEPEADYKTEKAHNEYITDAVLIGTMADVFGSDKFPLTRFMYTKVSYLLKRFKEEEDNGYLKKAAGPYKPKTRYGGAEKIALENKYVKKHISNYKGKKYENFVTGENATKAVEYFKKWYGENALQWIQQFKYTKRNQLELWATVDMAMQDLLLANKLVNFQTVKQLINDDKEWRPKLKRPIFSDENLKSAIVKLSQLFR